MSQAISNRPIVRPRIERRWIFEFEWKGVFEGWTRNYVNKNFWRVANYFGTHEDAMQECALIFARCADRYAGRVDNLSWFMSLYQTSVQNEWNTFSVKDTNMRKLAMSSTEVRMSLYQDDLEDSFGPAAAHAASAIDEIKLVLCLIANAPSEIIEFVFSTRSPVLLNRRLRRLSGISSQIDIVGVLKEYFST